MINNYLYKNTLAPDPKNVLEQPKIAYPARSFCSPFKNLIYKPH